MAYTFRESLSSFEAEGDPVSASASAGDSLSSVGDSVGGRGREGIEVPSYATGSPTLH